MKFNQSEEIMDYVNLFVSVLICFPEVGTIRYEKADGSIYFTFIMHDLVVGPETAAALTEIENALKSYLRLEGITPQRYAVRTFEYDQFVVFEAVRDVATVTRAEMSFLIELFRMKFLKHLIMENVDESMLDDFGWYQDGAAEPPSEKKYYAVNEGGDQGKILVLRESGRVLVFSN